MNGRKVSQHHVRLDPQCYSVSLSLISAVTVNLLASACTVSLCAFSENTGLLSLSQPSERQAIRDTINISTPFCLVLLCLRGVETRPLNSL